MTRRYHFATLGAELSQPGHMDLAQRTVVAARASPGRVADSLEHLGDGEGFAGGVGDLHDLAQAATELPGASRIGDVLLPPEDERRDSLGDFDGRAADAGGEGGGRKPVLPGTSARAPCMEGVYHEGLRAVRVDAGQARTTEQHRVPEARRPFRGDGSRLHGLFQASQHHVGQHLADGVAGGDGGRGGRVKDRPARGVHRDRAERACVVRNL